MDGERIYRSQQRLEGHLPFFVVETDGAAFAATRDLESRFASGISCLSVFVTLTGGRGPIYEGLAATWSTPTGPQDCFESYRHRTRLRRAWVYDRPVEEAIKAVERRLSALANNPQMDT